MKKTLLLAIVAILFPVLAIAQDYNHAITMPSITNAGDKNDNRIWISSGLLTSGGTDDNVVYSCTMGMWIRPTSYNTRTVNSYSTNAKVGQFFYFGADCHLNTNAWTIGFEGKDDGLGRIKCTGWGFAEMGLDGTYVTTEAVSLNEWHYISFVVDHAADKFYFYVDGTKTYEGNVTAGKGLRAFNDSSTEHPAFALGGYGYGGAIDEFQWYNRALSADEVNLAMTAPAAVSGLVGYYDFQEVIAGTTGEFANKAGFTATAGLNAKYQTTVHGYSSMWSNGSADLTATAANPDLTTITEELARAAAVTNVEYTVNVPASIANATIVVTADGETLAAGEHQLNAGTPIVVTVTPAEGYRLDAVKVNGNPVTNGVAFNLTSDITSITADLTELASIVYYTLTLSAGEGGSISAATPAGAVTSGASIEEGTQVTITATPAAGYELVAVKKNGANLASPYSFNMTADATVTAEFQVRTAVDYQWNTGTTTRTDRGVNTITVKDGGDNTLGTVSGNGSTSGRKIYVDRTSTVIETTAGTTLNIQCTSGSGVWMHSMIYIDYNKDGVFDAVLDQANHTVAANSELVAFNRGDFGGTYYKSTGVAVSGTQPGNADYQTTNSGSEIPAFTLPSSLAAGDYRIRYKVDWGFLEDANAINADRTENYITENGGTIIDFTLRIATAERTVTIASSDETMGTVAFADREGNVAENVEGPVTVVATPAEGYAFVNWTDQNNAVVATTATYTNNGTADVTLTANFGYSFKYTSNGEGSTQVTLAGNTVAAGATVGALPGAAVQVRVNPAEGKVATIRVNGVKVTVAGTTYSFNLSENTVLDVTYALPSQYLTLNVTGNGHVVVAADMDNDNQPVAPTYQNGDEVGDFLAIFLYADEGESVSSIVLNGENLDLEEEEEVGNYMQLEGEDNVWVYFYIPEGDVELAVTFTENVAGIDGIEADEVVAGPVEYYNLQGVKVAAENLAPGIYVRRQGTKATKVFVTK